METSTDIKEISKALFEFQGKMSTIVKKDKNPFFKSSYAGLPTILEAIDQPLKDTGLLVTQMPSGESGLTTMLIHVDSGQYFKSTNDMKAKANDPQALGSAITYNRRYTLVSMLRLNVDDDDDGNKGSTPPPKKSAPKQIPDRHDNDQANCELMTTASTLVELKTRWDKVPTDERTVAVVTAKDQRKKQLS